MNKFLHWLTRNKAPDLIIYAGGAPYIRRWWLLPKDKFPINIYLHHMKRDDYERSLHDHPWWFFSIILSGGYLELMPRNPAYWRWKLKHYPGSSWKFLYENFLIRKERKPGMIIFRRAVSPHRLELRDLVLGSWSICITGRPRRKWGFYDMGGWMEASAYIQKHYT